MSGQAQRDDVLVFATTSDRLLILSRCVPARAGWALVGRKRRVVPVGGAA